MEKEDKNAMNNQVVFEPQNWHACHDHNWQKCSLNANCYSYALNRPEYFWSVPGIGFAKAEAKKYIACFNNYFKEISLTEYRNELLQGAIRDGLIPIHEPIDRECYYLTALFFAHNEYDFHWFRKDDNGFWSHKDGWHAVSNKDDEGDLINLPSKTTHSPYSIFGGFFLVPHKGIELTQNFPI